MRRPRGPGGRFLTGEEIRALEQQQQQQQQATQQPPHPPQPSSRPQSANGTTANAVKGEPGPAPAPESVEA